MSIEMYLIEQIQPKNVLLHLHWLRWIQLSVIQLHIDSQYIPMYFSVCRH